MPHENYSLRKTPAACKSLFIPTRFAQVIDRYGRCAAAHWRKPPGRPKALGRGFVGYTRAMIIASPSDFREAARRRLPRFLFDYAEGGANSEVTLRRNVSDLTEIALAQRVLSGVGEVDLSTTLFGAEQSLPLILGPVGIAGMYRRRGEAA